MNAFPGHALGPPEHRSGVGQLSAVPVLFQDTPATFDQIVFAVLWWIVEEADRLADVVGKLDHALEELRAPAIALRFVIDLGLEVCDASGFVGGLTLPPRDETVYDEIAGFRRGSEGQMEGATVLIDDTERSVLFLASHILVGRAIVSPRLAAARVVANIHYRLAAHTQARNRFVLAIALTFPDSGEDGVGYCPLRFNTSDMRLREGSISSGNPCASTRLLGNRSRPPGHQHRRARRINTLPRSRRQQGGGV